AGEGYENPPLWPPGRGRQVEPGDQDEAQRRRREPQDEAPRNAEPHEGVVGPDRPPETAQADRLEGDGSDQAERPEDVQEEHERVENGRIHRQPPESSW